MNLLRETIGNTPIEQFAQNIAWAKIDHNDLHNDVHCGSYVLPPNHTLDEAIAFLKSLDFEYNNGYGLQQIYGVIVFKDNTWLDRGEYDGSEWWNYNSLPQWKEEYL